VGQAAYLAQVKRGGTSTAFASEAMSLVSGNTYQITDATKRIWDRTVVPTFSEDSVPIPASDVVSIDYLFGKVTFATAKTGNIFADGKFIPTVVVAGAHAYGVNMSHNILDDTDFDGAQTSNGFRSKIYGIGDVSISLGRWEVLDSTFFTAINARTPIVVDIRPGGVGDYARGWFVVESEAHGGGIDDLESRDLTFQLDGDAKASFGWGQ